MKQIYNSIKFKAFVYLFSFILLLILLIAYLSLQKIRTSVFNAVDTTLTSESNLITDLMKIEEGHIDLEVTEMVTGDYTIPKSGHYYKLIINGNNDIGFKDDKTEKIVNTVISPSLVNENFDFPVNRIEYTLPQKNELFFSSTGPNLEPLRVLRKSVNLNGVSIIVYTAETIKQNLKLINDFNYFILLLLPIALIVSAIIILILINNILKPVKDFSQELSLITHKNLDKRLNENEYVFELQDMIISFNGMLDRIHKAFETEKLVLSEASHKLKTPIAVIKSYCDITLKKERTNQEYIETIISIKNGTNKIVSLISGILSFAKLESENINYNKSENFSIIECINDSIEITKYLAQQKRIDIRINNLTNKSISISGDKDKITEAIFNIIENSIKYNNRNGFIEINLEQINQQIKLSIKDNGIGIEANDLPKIFDRFYRVNNESIEGNGLGLSISKTIIESHQGTINVNSQMNIGTEFIITLPLKQTDF